MAPLLVCVGPKGCSSKESVFKRWGRSISVRTVSRVGGWEEGEGGEREGGREGGCNRTPASPALRLSRSRSSSEEDEQRFPSAVERADPDWDLIRVHARGEPPGGES